ncbi:MAG: hypothetical protein JXR03_05040 [Cyclobacteriaceae bacterium]
MKKLFCEVYDNDRFSKELILEFINKTEGIAVKNGSPEPADIIFADLDSNEPNMSFDRLQSQLIIISSDKKHIHSLFQDKITDYLHKPDLSYERFLVSIDKVRKKA